MITGNHKDGCDLSQSLQEFVHEYTALGCQINLVMKNITGDDDGSITRLIVFLDK
jgi:hypothetical protein